MQCNTKVDLLQRHTETICRYLHAQLHHKKIQKYQHEISKRPQHSPYPSAPKKYRTEAQELIKLDDSKTTGPKRINRV